MKLAAEYLNDLNKDKFDPALGEEVRKHLVSLNMENPVLEGPVDATGETSPIGDPYNPSEALIHITAGIKSGLHCLGINMNDPSMQDTPIRYAKMLVGELTRGLCYDLFPKCTSTPNGTSDGYHENGYPKAKKGAHDQMVLVNNIQVLSLCEHHLQTIDGFAHIAYIPKDKLLGLSKFARVTEFFARRPQVQERLTDQIYHALSYILDTDDIAVVIKAKHYCMKARGSLQHASETTTNKMGGKFMTNAALREEFFDGI